MIETILGVVAGVGTVASSANSIISLVQKIKGMLSKETSSSSQENMAFFSSQNSSVQMQAFQSQMQDPFAGGNQWIPELQNMACQFGSSWIPQQTQGIQGINLTGIWSPPMNPYDQTYIRQYGPYINIIAGIGGNPTLYAEGLFNPMQGILHVVGKNMIGQPVEAKTQVFPNWTMQGIIITMNPFGQPMQYPLMMAKVC